MSNNNSGIDMKELMRVAKEQQMQQTRERIEAQKPRKKLNTTPINQSNEHGSYVQTPDGVGGIIIDNDHEINKMRENDVTGNTLLALVDNSKLIIDANAYKPQYIVKAFYVNLNIKYF